MGMELFFISTVVMDVLTFICDKLYRTKSQTHIQISPSKTGLIRIKSVDCVNVKTLVVTVYWSSAKCYHCTLQVCRGSLCITSYNFI